MRVSPVCRCAGGERDTHLHTHNADHSHAHTTPHACIDGGMCALRLPACAQEAALTLPNTAMVTAVDLGDSTSPHRRAPRPCTVWLPAPAPKALLSLSVHNRSAGASLGGAGTCTRATRRLSGRGSRRRCCSTSTRGAGGLPRCLLAPLRLSGPLRPCRRIDRVSKGSDVPPPPAPTPSEFQAQEHGDAVPGPCVHPRGGGGGVRGDRPRGRPLRRDHHRARAGPEGRLVPEGGARFHFPLLITL